MRRLDALAAAVPHDALSVADVGHDHGLLIAALLRARPRLRAIGVERRAGAAADFAARFAAEQAAWGPRLSLRQGRDFEALAEGEAEVVVMAGFGERAMLDALDRGAALSRLPRRLVLCPAGFEVSLRPGLSERGWLVVSERLVREGGRFFEVLAVERRGLEPASEAERRWGSALLRRPDPLLGAYLADLRRRQGAAIARARGSGAAGSALLAKLALLPELEALLRAAPARACEDRSVPRRRIYVDLDDVLSETTSRFPAVVRELFGRSKDFEDIHSFHLDVAFGLDAEQVRLLFEHVHAGDFLTALEPRRGALEVLEGWEAGGHEIRVVTGRPPESHAHSVEWLSRHGVPHASFHLCDKYGRFGAEAGTLRLEEIRELDFHVAIEDSLEMAVRLAEWGVPQVLLLDRPWNRADAELSPGAKSRLRRVADWMEIRERVSL